MSVCMSVCLIHCGCVLLVVDGGDDRSFGAVETGDTAAQGRSHQGQLNQYYIRNFIEECFSFEFNIFKIAKIVSLFKVMLHSDYPW